MKDLVLTIVKALVSDPDAVVVNETVNGNDIRLELSVAPNDMGKVIGKQGRIAKSIRTLVKSAGTAEGKNVTLDIV